MNINNSHLPVPLLLAAVFAGSLLGGAVVGGAYEYQNEQGVEKLERPAGVKEFRERIQGPARQLRPATIVIAEVHRHD